MNFKLAIFTFRIPDSYAFFGVQPKDTLCFTKVIDKNATNTKNTTNSSTDQITTAYYRRMHFMQNARAKAAPSELIVWHQHYFTDVSDHDEKRKGNRYYWRYLGGVSCVAEFKESTNRCVYVCYRRGWRRWGLRYPYPLHPLAVQRYGGKLRWTAAGVWFSWVASPNEMLDKNDTGLALFPIYFSELLSVGSKLLAKLLIRHMQEW